MRISGYRLQETPLFEMKRAAAGVTLHFDYDLSGSYDADQDLWVWDGELLSDLGDDASGVHQNVDRPMTLTYAATLQDGVTERGSYEVRDAGDRGVEIRVEFDVTVYSTAATFVGSGGVSHFVFGSEEADSATGEDKADVFAGGGGADSLSGAGGDDRLFGGKQDDSVEGGDGADRLRGGSGHDRIEGGDGDDRIVGGLGRDTLTGGDGADSFVFRDRDADTVTDFVSGEDRILLSHDQFDAIDLGRLQDGVFAVIDGGVATDGDQRLIYDQGAGLLYYDADGSGAGDAVLIADLRAGTALTADDILVI